MNAKTLRKLPKGADLSHIHPDMHVLAVPITALSRHPDNPRKHPDANKKAIAGSLRKYLQRKPVVANRSELERMAEALYFAYGEDASWKNFQNAAMPTWPALPQAIRDHWIATARQAKALQTARAIKMHSQQA